MREAQHHVCWHKVASSLSPAKQEAQEAQQSMSDILERASEAAGFGGFRTRVAKGSGNDVKKLFLKSATVFPEFSEEKTGACFDDLQTFILASDDRRKDMIESDAKDVHEWKDQKAILEAGVQKNNDDIATSKKKIVEWRKRIDEEKIAVAKKQDSNDEAQKKIDEINLNIRDVEPGLEVMQGIEEHSDVLFSAPRMDTLMQVARPYGVTSKSDIKGKVGSDRILAANFARSLSVSAVNYHASHTRVIKVSFAEIGQMGSAALVDLCANLLGFGSPVGIRRGLLAARVSRCRSLSNERKRKADGEEEESEGSARKPKVGRRT